jgi:HD-GYP domain-containing protein (c-di-GMP phosphodiesterase class II)
VAEDPLGKIDFSRYQRWLERMAGRECAIKAFDAQGKSVRVPADPEDAELARRLLAAPKEEGAAVRRLDVEDGKIVLYRPLPLGDGASSGWAALVADNKNLSNAPLELDRMAEAFDDLVDAAADEIRAEHELDKITEELGECYEELHLVYAVDAHVKESTGGDEALLRALLQSTAEHMGADVAAYVRPEDGVCIYATSRGKEIGNLDLVLVEMRGDLFRFVQASKETMVLNDADDARRPYVFTDMPYRVLACPIEVKRKIGGMVVLLNHMHKRPFSNSDRHLLEVLATQLSSLAKVEMLMRRMGNFTEQMADALVEAVEAKDPYTRGHSERVNLLSIEIGKELGLAGEELQDLHWGSLLHDVGKIGIPDAVLCKPARLSKDEYTFIRVHPERSYDILRNVEQLKNALPGVRHHQEMYDGKGYPHGLQGKRIPLHARIMAVADTYDSITSSRAYRPGRSHEVAMAEIERVSGSQLDPAIVDVFKKICASEPAWLKQFNIRRDKVA